MKLAPADNHIRLRHDLFSAAEKSHILYAAYVECCGFYIYFPEMMNCNLFLAALRMTILCTHPRLMVRIRSSVSVGVVNWLGNEMKFLRNLECIDVS